MGKGQAPNRVVYAFVIPTTRSMLAWPEAGAGARPAAVEQFDDVNVRIRAVVEVEETSPAPPPQQVVSTARASWSSETVSTT